MGVLVGPSLDITIPRGWRIHEILSKKARQGDLWRAGWELNLGWDHQPSRSVVTSCYAAIITIDHPCFWRLLGGRGGAGRGGAGRGGAGRV
jgi:hypothetical protein